MKLPWVALPILFGLCACSPSPTGVPAQTENEMLAETYTGHWATYLALAPIPVSFMQDVKSGFHASYTICGLVPHGQRRIVYDSNCMESSDKPALRWVAAHEVAHIYYRDYEHDANCQREMRADDLANKLTGFQAKSHSECPTSSAMRVIQAH